MKCGTRRAVGSLALVILLFAPLARGQGIITTVAGNTWILHGDGGPAIGAPLYGVNGVSVDAAGNVYASAQENSVVMKISPDGILKVVAGNDGGLGGYGDGGPGTLASLNKPSGVAVDAAGNVYIADGGRVRKVSPAGIISTVAGSGYVGSSGDGGPATSASLAGASGVAVDAAGNLYIADGSSRIRKVTPSGIISTVAGSGVWGFFGDGGPATSAALAGASGVAVDAAGNVYIADHSNCRIRKVTPSGIISTVVGNGVWGFSGDGGLAADASLTGPEAVAVDAAANIYIADWGNNVIRKVNPSGIISTVAGNGTVGYFGDGGPATSASLNWTAGVAADAAGNIYIADKWNNRIRKVSPSGIISTLAGSGWQTFSGDGGPATCASMYLPKGVALDAGGNLYIANEGNARVRKVSPSGTITTVAGNGIYGFSGDGGPATSAALDQPQSVAVDGAGNLYIADAWNARIRKVSPSGTITTVAGNGGGFSGDGGPATSASLSHPSGLALDAAGNLYIADQNNARIRKVSPSGIISTVAGNGAHGFSGDGGPSTTASLNRPSGVTVDAVGNFFIADADNRRIRKVSPAGIISTAAGSGTAGFSGDGGPATSASLDLDPVWGAGVAVDALGNLYISDTKNHRIRKVNPSGIISTVAGNGRAGFSGDGVPATVASLYLPSGMVVDGTGNLYIADTSNNVVRKVLAGPPPGGSTEGRISTGGVTNGASFAAGLTPGSIVAVFGVGITKAVSGISPATSLPLPTSLGGISVSIGGMPAPLFAVANVAGREQINLQVPYEITGLPTVSIQVNANGVLSNTVQVTVLQAHPGIFTMDGAAGAILHGNSNALVTATNPAAPNEVITIYATGLGPVSPAPKTGNPAPTTEPLARTAVTPTVRIGAVNAPVLFSGLAPGFVGLYQVNAQVPDGITPGDALPVVIAQSSVSSNLATIAVR
jgi:uncharacterized protein (TIGR03437 family)